VTTAILRIRGLNKWYGAYHALRSIELEVRAGERVVICGPSGSGKSSLIRCINGIEAFQEGELHVCGVTLGREATAARLTAVRRQVGMVFQQFNLFPRRRPRSRCWHACGWRSTRTSIPPSFPAASSSAWRSRGRCA
jgi:ABC-type polar amino acid transport system ATPase subunit